MKKYMVNYRHVAAKLGMINSLLFFAIRLLAQDIHFSQFNFSPINQNPANTNLFNGDYRFVANYKNQWPSVPVRFNTFSASAEMNFKTLNNGDRVGGALLFYFDRAGDSKFQALNVAVSPSYIKALGAKKDHAISVGVQLGLVNRSISYDQLYFDNQWNGDVYNPNIPVDENFLRHRFVFFDLGAGIAYKWTKTERTNLTLGFGATHLTQPSQTFFNASNVKLNPRYSAHVRAQVKIANRVDVLPEFMFQRQDVKQEFLYGAHFKYYLPVKIPHTVALNLGGYGRSAEAAWLLAGVDFDQWQVNMSYDINASQLAAASRYNGGFEMSVIYILAKVKKINKPAAVCPAFL